MLRRSRSPIFKMMTLLAISPMALPVGLDALKFVGQPIVTAFLGLSLFRLSTQVAATPTRQSALDRAAPSGLAVAPYFAWAAAALPPRAALRWVATSASLSCAKAADLREGSSSLVT